MSSNSNRSKHQSQLYAERLPIPSSTGELLISHKSESTKKISPSLENSISETHMPKKTITGQPFTRDDINVNASKMLIQPCSISYNATTSNVGAQPITMATQHCLC